jgi:feruloyl esterase
MNVRRCAVAARSRVSTAVTAATFAALLAASREAAAMSACESLRTLTLPDATISDAIDVAANSAPFYSARAFCRVLLTIAPTPRSDIKVEVWLPAADWNGKFQGVGNSDAAGVISYDAMREAIRRGYATSSTDTGHVGNTLAFALGPREKYVDFGYRAVHEMTVKAKAIVEAFYGTPAAHSVWNGCSQGGRQGITEAIRYPSDYDAIIAGAPAIGHMRLHAMRLALNSFVHRAGDSFIPPEKYPLIHRAAMNACDALDGVADGLIANPSVCRFDPAVLECAKSDDALCLTPAQVETARGMYAPITDPSNGRVLSTPLLQPGSELGWERLAGAEPLVNAVEPFKYVVFKNARWDWRTFRLSSDLPHALLADQGIIDRTDPNLQPFFDKGGKLLLYHGWADPQVPALATVAYFNAVLKATSEERRGTAIELYMQPGVNHCWGGDGPDTFDAVGAVEQWVRSGRAPDRITASQWTATVSRSRPLCPYPQVAQYVGRGNIDRADSFVCTTDALPTARRTEHLRDIESSRK